MGTRSYYIICSLYIILFGNIKKTASWDFARYNKVPTWSGSTIGSAPDCLSDGCEFESRPFR